MNYTSLLGVSTTGIVFIALGGALLLFIFLFCLLVPIKFWVHAMLSGAYIPSYRLVALRSRKIDLKKIVEAYILSKKSKMGFSLDQLEAHYLSGGDCMELLSALVKAKGTNIPLNVPLAKTIDLTSHNLNEVIDSAIEPKPISIESISAVTQDSIELIVSVNGTVKVNIDKYYSELGEETLRNRIVNFVISNIALSGNHKTALLTPDIFVRDWQKASLDEGCSVILCDLQVKSVDIGRDIGAEMATKRAEREKAYLEINAQKEKNAEMQKELQMKTRVEEMKGEVLSAEAEVPKAIADAIKEGRFSVMDYYKLMNLQADTALRRSIISDEKAKKRG